MAKKIDSFVNLYPVSKTLRFKAIPVGKTQENIDKKQLIEEDEIRAEAYSKAKEIITRYHKEFINSTLKDVSLKKLEKYASIFLKEKRDKDEEQVLLECEADMRQQISDKFTESPNFKRLFRK